jgi:hypothetical protein
MINFFRKIRRQLANENKFQKYSRYAFGEILLVVIGILIALQVNNWNENRKQNAQFNITLEQLYNSIKFDTDNLNGTINYSDYLIRAIDNILIKPDSLQDYYLPYALYNFLISDDQYKSQSPYHAQNLKFNPDDYLQNEISKQIINYANNLDFIDYSIDDDIANSIKKINLAFPKVDVNSPNEGWVFSDSTYYSHEDLVKSKELINSNAFKSILKTYRTKLIYQKFNAVKRQGDGLSLMKLIKNYYPEAKVLYVDVGVKGTAIDGFDNVNGKSTPMKLTDVENGLWEVDIYLLEGKIKFRCRDSWAINWGADTFPKGVGVHDGPDISIPEEGNYHVIFKPATGEYEFIKQAD